MCIVSAALSRQACVQVAVIHARRHSVRQQTLADYNYICVQEATPIRDPLLVIIEAYSNYFALKYPPKIRQQSFCLCVLFQ
jgi:hypothetical protein